VGAATRTRLATALVAVGIAAGLIASAPAAATSFSGKVCKLVNPVAVTRLDVVDACTPSKTSHTPVATVWAARWGNASHFVGDPTSCDFGAPAICELDVQVWKPKHASWYGVFKKEAKAKMDPEDFAGPVSHLGAFARADVGSTGETLYFLVHGYGVIAFLKHESCSPDPNDPASNICSVDQNLGAIGAKMTHIGRTIAKKL
jgi:hypothetical protein